MPHFTQKKKCGPRVRQLSRVTQPVVAGQYPQGSCLDTLTTLEKVKEGRGICQNKENFPASVLGHCICLTDMGTLAIVCKEL